MTSRHSEAAATVKSVDPDEARERAQNIVDGFAPKNPPKPFRGALDWLGDRLEPILQSVGRPVSWLFESFPAPVAWLILALALAAIATVIVNVASRHRRAADGRRLPERRGRPTHESPEALEAAADEAVERGDLDLAVRLRFRAGLLRLDRDAHAIRYHDGIGTGEVRQAVAQITFEALADTFDRVTYGDDSARAEDDDQARSDWPRVVKVARR